MNKLNALIIESTQLYRELITRLLGDMGVNCVVFNNGNDALSAQHELAYAFIITSRHLEDMSAEIFLHRFREEWDIDDALAIMLTSSEVEDVQIGANRVGFKLIFNKQDITLLENFLIGVINRRTIDIEGNILLLEDSKSVANFVIQQLSNYHAEVDHFMSVDAAFRAFSEKDYDIAIIDYYLEGEETGGQFIQLVRNMDDIDKSKVPLLVASAETDQTKRTAILRNGASDFIIKPYDNDELLVRVSNLIEHKRLYQTAKEQQKELKQLAMVDQLTGLYNKNSLTNMGPKYLSDANRHGFVMSLLVIDLDFFKKINDTKGHAVGDIVLSTVGKLLGDECRKEDFVARFGGEEFVMLLTHCELEHALGKAETIRQKIEASKPEGLTVTASIGVAISKNDDEFDHLFVAADQAVYEAKESGRNRVVANTRD